MIDEDLCGHTEFHKSRTLCYVLFFNFIYATIM